MLEREDGGGLEVGEFGLKLEEGVGFLEEVLF